MSSSIAVAGPSQSPEDIDLVGRLWRRLHAHHQAVSPYRGLVPDLDVSWDRRRRWYISLMEQGGALWIARDQDGEPVAYAFATLVVGADDTFESTGTAELVSLIVDESFRGSGIGQGLIQAVEQEARIRGIDLFKVAVMAGNDTAMRFISRTGSNWLSRSCTGRSRKRVGQADTLRRSPTQPTRIAPVRPSQKRHA